MIWQLAATASRDIAQRDRNRANVRARHAARVTLNKQSTCTDPKCCVVLANDVWGVAGADSLGTVMVTFG